MAFNVNPRLASALSPRAPRIVYGNYEDESESFKAGQWVVLSGETTVGALGNVEVVATSGTLVAGIAMKDATNVTAGGVEIPIMELRAGDEIIMPTYNSNTSAAYASNLYVPGYKYGLKVTGNVVYADFYNTTNDCVEFKEPIYDAGGSATYWGLFELIPACAQFGIGI